MKAFAIGIILALSVSLPAIAQQKAKKGDSCVRCTVRCGQCSGSDRCINACKANGDPLVKASSACGTWYEECKKKR